jgi:hypothetical protein
MSVDITVRTCQMIGNKVLLILELKNSQTYWGQPLTLSLRNKSLRVTAAFSMLASVEIPVFSYDTQYLAKPEIIEFVNGNIGFGYWINKTTSFVSGDNFEVDIKTNNPILYEDFIKAKIEQPISAAQKNDQKEQNMNQEQYVKGQTFDVFPEESDRRYLFDYYLFDINTDEVIESSALIVPGTTIDEATRNAIQKMQGKLANKVSSTVKVHLNYVKIFTKPKPEEDTFQKMADAIARGVREGMQK